MRKLAQWVVGAVFFGIIVIADEVSTRARIKSGANKRIDPVELPPEWMQTDEES